MGADELTATVVGGGIAGLASAIALAQAGWRVTVLERAAAFGEIGAGLATTGNGMTALTALGLGEAIREVAYQTGTAGMQDQAGRWIMRMPDTRSDPTAVTTIWGLQRQRLHGVLRAAAEAADGVELVTGAEVVAVTASRPDQPGGGPVTVSWRNGTTGHAEKVALLVAADGVRSATRARLFPSVSERYSGSTSWRAIIPDTDSEDRLVQAWGPGTEFGSLRVSPTEIYWYGYFRHPERRRSRPAATWRRRWPRSTAPGGRAAGRSPGPRSCPPGSAATSAAAGGSRSATPSSAAFRPRGWSRRASRS
jgi:2-polyprenyl-6-methoxyphenol hydroxylase-like FAD-dependent oxidoreductase